MRLHVFLLLILHHAAAAAVITYSFLLITKYHYQSYRLYYNLEIVNIHWLSIKIVLWPFRLYQIMKFVSDKKKSWAWQSQSSRHSSDRPRHLIKILPNTSPDEESEEYDTILLRRWYVVRRAIWAYAQRHFLPVILYVSAKKDKIIATKTSSNGFACGNP